MFESIHTSIRTIALLHLGLLDSVLDKLLHLSSLLHLRPPGWAFVVALYVELFTGTTVRMKLIALLAAKATGIAA